MLRIQRHVRVGIVSPKGDQRPWRPIFEGLAKRCGKKKAIVAISRRLLCMMVAMVKSGTPYRLAVEKRPA